MLSYFLGTTPGCLGAFMNVSLYMYGVISFGAIVGGMIATSGDEAFVMLAQFPGQAVLLFGLLFVHWGLTFFDLESFTHGEKGCGNEQGNKWLDLLPIIWEKRFKESRIQGP